MSQVPARLVYTDSGGTEQVIGSFQPQDVTTGNISTFTIEENAKNYTRVIIEGGPTLQDSMPTDLSEFQSDEPEIRAEIDSDLDGTWETRARVYPEIEGTTNDRGRYKNKDLWGFKKYYGEDDVDTGTVNTDLTAALDALLPDGYVASYPGDITAPNVSNYSFSGARQQGFRELQRYYNHFIFFTTATDGSGDYIVRLQPKGYGDTQFSLTRGTDGYTYNYWKKADSSNVVSKVKVIGKDSNNEKVERVVAAGASDGVHGDDTDVDVYLGSPEPARRKFRRIHVDYTITTGEADDIAENVITPEAIEQGEIEDELRPQSTLNDSVGLVDNNRTPNNPIDDVFTVVKQKDFFHQGVTQYSFEFEKEATQEQVDKWTEHDFERASVYPESTQQEDVGNQTVNADTETVQEQYDADAQNDHLHSNATSTSDVIGNIAFVSTDQTAPTNVSIDDGGYTTVATVNDADGGYLHYLYFAITDIDATSDLWISVVGGGSEEIWFQKVNDVGAISSSEANYIFFEDYMGPTFTAYEMKIIVDPGQGSTNVDAEMAVFDINHDHTVPIADTDGNTADITIDVNTNDASAGDTSSLTVDGDTAQQLIDIITSTEEKTDR